MDGSPLTNCLVLPLWNWRHWRHCRVQITRIQLTLQLGNLRFVGNPLFDVICSQQTCVKNAKKPAAQLHRKLPSKMRRNLWNNYTENYRAKCERERGRERQRTTETENDRDRERQRQRTTDRERQTENDRERTTETENDRDRERQRQRTTDRERQRQRTTETENDRDRERERTNTHTFRGVFFPSLLLHLPLFYGHVSDARIPWFPILSLVS